MLFNRSLGCWSRVETVEEYHIEVPVTGCACHKRYRCPVCYCYHRHIGHGDFVIVVRLPRATVVANVTLLAHKGTSESLTVAGTGIGGE